MIALGLDPSLTGFGWCIHDSEASGPARIIAKGQFKTKASDIFVTRYMSLRDSVSKLLAEYPEIEAIGVESPPFGALWSEGLYGLFLYVNEAIFEARKDVVYFDPQSLKMLVKIDPNVRRGKMHKLDMVNAAKADTGIKGKINHNEADAYHLARFAARFFAFLRGQIEKDDLTPAERKAFDRISRKRDDRFFEFSELKAA